ncbi:NAD(P)-binding protein [Elongatibacter sediminis]|uniref:NAD(P)-binding protein n=1 Tax=Elongatibacter sediminis TaxID=3119006 RepID=A0AAW9RI23_9GAMM
MTHPHGPKRTLKITRRDFVNGVAAGVGAALLGRPAPGLAATAAWPDESWYGYGGVGDYRLSHGNSPGVVRAAHGVRDGAFADRLASVNADEDYDVVIVGAGMAGLGAALEFTKRRGDGQRCLILDNHPIFGGEAKENAFEVDGQRLLAPQGANGFFVPPEAPDWSQASGDPRYYSELGIPRRFDWAEWARDEGSNRAPGEATDEAPIRFCRDNYGYLVRGLQDNTSVGHFFADGDGGGQWAVDMFRNGLADTPLSPRQRAALMDWYAAGDRLRDFGDEEQARRFLDSMSYRDFLINELGLGPEGADYAGLFLASACGLGSDVTSAWAARTFPMPGLFETPDPDLRRASFPGGNSGFARYFLKALIPDAIAGAARFEDIITGGIRLDALDRPGQPVRIRLDSTAVHVAHAGSPDQADHVTVTYSQQGRLRAVRARAVVMASGAWINRYVVADLPEAHQEATARFRHAPFLVANVALTNWRFLERLGISAAIWNSGEHEFGITCNIRQPMHVGEYRPPLHPDRPTVLSFYTPFFYPGSPLDEQLARGRAELLATSYADYERRIISQMNRLFADAGFRPERDVAGIILNRWGHAFSVPFPGFYGGAGGGPGPARIARRPYGRIAFGHSELHRDGTQHWGPAADEGRRAMTEALAAS